MLSNLKLSHRFQELILDTMDAITKHINPEILEKRIETLRKQISEHQNSHYDLSDSISDSQTGPGDICNCSTCQYMRRVEKEWIDRGIIA